MSGELSAWAARQSARVREPLACKVCGAASAPFDVVDFAKTCNPGLYPQGLAGIPVYYHRCTDCGFIFTAFFDDFTPEQWREHVYNAAYVRVDPEYADIRPRRNARELQSFLGRRQQLVGLDYGGGNGTTAALMREAGWTFASCDPYGHSDLAPEQVGRFDFCSALEVLEHTPQPAQALQAIVGMCTPGPLVVFIGTAVHDGLVTAQSRLSWWYAAPRNGHISLFSREALRRLGAACGLDYASITRGTHLLTRGISPMAARAMLLRGKVRMVLDRRPLA